MRIFYLCCIVLLFNVCSFAQKQFDTITVMQYNLLSYNASGIDCTPLSIDVRNNYFNTIINYTLPDLFAAEEVENSRYTVASILGSVLNTNGRNYYDSANFIKEPGYTENTTNMVFYNKRKLKLLSQDVIACYPRQATVYNFQYSSAKNRDYNAYLSFVVVHLKASKGSSNEDERTTCVDNIMKYLAFVNNRKINYFIAGDFNFYSTDEQAYNNLTANANGRINFVDPVYSLIQFNTITGNNYYNGYNNTVGTGVWNNLKFSPYHTQCPIIDGNNCASGGGLNDRFDYLLCTKSVIDDSTNVNFIPGSYKAIGNDGYHYNLNITDGFNTSAPTTVVSALSMMSDHLPVSLKLRIDLPYNPSGLYSGTINTVTSQIVLTNTNQTISGSYITSVPDMITIVGLVTNVQPNTNVTLSGTYSLSNNDQLLLTTTSLITATGSGSISGISLDKNILEKVEILIINPFQNFLTVKMSSQELADQLLDVCIYSLSGQVLLKNTIRFSAEGRGLLYLPTESLTYGTYITTFISKEGMRTSRKIFKDQ